MNAPEREPDLVVILPLPGQAVSPNARLHWSKAAPAKAKYRNDARLATLADARNGGIEDRMLAWQQVIVLPVFYFRYRRGRDRDNALASLKSAFDGMADAGLVENDKFLIPLTPRFELDREKPRLEMHCWELN